MTETRLLLVDDEPLVRSGLRAVLGTPPDLTVVGEAGDGAEVPAAVRQHRPDVVLMDVRMPHLDGIAATERLMAGDDPPKVVVVTTFENDEYVYDALRSGASGFLLKRSRPTEIIQAVRTVATGDTLLFPAAVRSLAQSYGARADSPLAETFTNLTDREQDVLRAVARGLSNVEVGHELYVTPETVKTHVGNILAKLGVRDRVQAVILAYESGFVAAGGRGPDVTP